MNKIILTLLVVTTFCFTAYAQNEKRMQTLNKVLIVYFSATHTTAKVAHLIANITGGTLYEIILNGFTHLKILIGITKCHVAQ